MAAKFLILSEAFIVTRCKIFPKAFEGQFTWKLQFILPKKKGTTDTNTSTESDKSCVGECFIGSRWAHKNHRFWPSKIWYDRGDESKQFCGNYRVSVWHLIHVFYNINVSCQNFICIWCFPFQAPSLYNPDDFCKYLTVTDYFSWIGSESISKTLYLYLIKLGCLAEIKFLPGSWYF